MTDTNNYPIWPGWETVRLIGRGSFGAVYEIERDVFGHKEKAALKMISIPQNDSDIEELYDSGYDEASVTATFKSHLESIVNEYSLMREMNGSANVVNCDDFRVVPHDDNIGWDIYIRMELLTPLTKAVGNDIMEPEVVKIAVHMCNALTLCKKYSIVHRDIKPQNIFVSRNGDYKLGDFGVSRTLEHTMGTTMTGTYAFMAPEIYNHKPYNLQSDIYSLGLVLYWLLNEKRMPFLPLPPNAVKQSDTDKAQARRFAGEPIPAPKNGSEELKRIVLKACAYDVNERYQTADEMLTDLGALATESRGASAPTPGVKIRYDNSGPDEGETETLGLWKKDRGADRIEEESSTVGVWNQPKRDGAADLPSSSRQGKKKRFWIILGTLCGLLAAVLLIFFFGIHKWIPATCMEPKTCSICGKQTGEALAHSWKDATCTKPETCSVCGEERGEALGHSWKDATCTEPETCSVCGEERGEALAHSWKDATCTKPETCSVCGEERGEALGHSWKDATCTKPETCSVCGEERGESLGHSWQEATYTSPKRCSRCGEETGSPKAKPTPQPTATPAPTPTPVISTPKPTPEKRPSFADLDALGDNITYPKTNSYLDSYETMYVKTGGGHSAYVYWDSSGQWDHRRSRYVYEKDKVTVLARENGFSCIICTNKEGQTFAGWVGSSFLVYEY